LEVIQGVLIKVRVEGAEAIERFVGALDRVTQSTDRAAAGAEKGAEKFKVLGTTAGSAAKSIEGMTPPTTSFQKTLENLVQGGLNPAVSALAKFAGWVLPVGVVAGMAAVAKHSIDAADSLNDMSKRTGMAVETLSTLAYGAKMADTSLDSVMIGVRHMSMALEEAAKGSKEMQRAFSVVGVTLDDLRTKTPEQLFFKLADGIANVKDPTQRLAVAQQILGRSAQDLLPFIEDLANGGYGKLRQEAEKAGVVVGTDFARASDQFNDALEKAKAPLTAMAKDFAIALLPALNQTIEAMNSDSWTSWLNPLRAIREAIRGIAGAAAIAGTAIGAFLGALQNPGRNKDGTPLGFVDSLKDLWQKTKEGFMESPDLQKQLEGMFGGPVASPASSPAAPANRHVIDAAAAEAAARAAAAAKMAATERAHELDSLIGIQLEMQKVLGASSAQSELEKKINGLLSQRDAQLNAIAKMKQLTPDEKNWWTQNIMSTYSSAVQAENQKALDDAAKQFNEKWRADRQKAFQEELDHNLAALSDRGKKMLDDMRKYWLGASVEFGAAMNQQLSSALADAAMTGGKNLGQIAGQTFGSLVSSGTDKIVQKLTIGIAGLFGDSIKQTADNHWLANGQRFDTFEEASAWTKTGRGLSAAMGFAQIGMSAYASGAQPGGRTAGTLGGAAAGAGIGAQLGSSAGPYGIAIGAVIGAVVGAVGSWLGEKEAQSQYKYGAPGINALGQAYMYTPKNMQPAEVQQILERAQNTFDSVRNSYVNILLKLPNSIIPALKTIDGRFQDNPSQNYLKHLEQWLTDTLPKQIAAQFESGMRSAFAAAGMDESAFNRYLAQTKGLDPSKAVQFWTDMADGINAWNRARQEMAAVRSVVYDDVSSGQLGILAGRYKFSNGAVQETGTSDFAADVRKSGEGLFALGRQMVNLTGPDRVAAFKALGQGIQAVTDSLQSYIQQIGETIRNLRQSFDDERLAKEVERAPDKKAAADLLYRAYQNTLNQINNASSLGLSPAEVEALTKRGVGILNQIYQLDPSDEVYAWWKRQMDNLEELSTRSLEKLAKDATDQVTALLTSLDPFRQWMLGLPVNLAPAWNALDTQISGAAAALGDLARAIRDTAAAGQTKPGGGGGGGTHQPSTDNPDTGNQGVVVNINASVFGVDDLTNKVISGVRTAMRKNPDAFQQAF